MAKKKGTRKMSGIEEVTDFALKIAAVGAGAVLAREANSIAAKQWTTVMASPTISGFIQAAGGAALAYFAKGEPFLEYMGYGMAGQGLMVVAVSNVMALDGIPGSTTYSVAPSNQRQLAGGNFKTIAGNFNTIAGPSPSRLNGARERKNPNHSFVF